MSDRLGSLFVAVTVGMAEFIAVRRNDYAFASGLFVFTFIYMVGEIINRIGDKKA